MNNLFKDRVRAAITGGVANVRLSRPDKLNAIDDAMFAALAEAGEWLAGVPGLRAAVLSGEGRAFCAGLDRGGFERMAAGTPDPQLERMGPGGANGAQRAVTVWRELPVPVIAAVHGVALGGGLQIALGADLRFVAPGARMGLLETQWGIIPDMGGIALARTLLRDDVLRDLVYTGRLVGAEEAVRLGLATRLCDDPHAEALAAAAAIAAHNPDAIRAAKRVIGAAHDLPFAGVLAAEAREQLALIGTPNQVEAVRAAAEGRPPRFADVAGVAGGGA